MGAQVIQLHARHRAAPSLPPAARPVATSSAPGTDVASADMRQMVTAALRSWMDGDPLTQREQRIVDLVLDTNYFGQLGRLAMGV